MIGYEGAFIAQRSLLSADMSHALELLHDMVIGCAILDLVDRIYVHVLGVLALFDLLFFLVFILVLRGLGVHLRSLSFSSGFLVLILGIVVLYLEQLANLLEVFAFNEGGKPRRTQVEQWLDV